MLVALLMLGCGSAPSDPSQATRPATDVTGDTASQTGDTGAPPVVWTEEGVIVDCAEPTNGWTRSTVPRERSEDIRFAGSGAAVADLDGDGQLEIVLPGPELGRLYSYTEAGLVAHEDPWPGVDFTEAVGASAADFDSDGDIDLHITRYGLPDLLLDNDGHGRFVDIAAQAGVDGGERHSFSSAWTDRDGDGDLDLVVSGHGTHEASEVLHIKTPGDPSGLYDNLGDGTFADVSHLLPEPAQEAFSFLATWTDFDNDGMPDLYFANDFPQWMPPLGVRWDADTSTYEELQGVGLSVRQASMGTAAADINGDGIDDFFSPAWSKAAALLSVDGRWIDQTAAIGLAPLPEQVVGWGAEWVDLDNDGDLDIHAAYGFLTVLHDQTGSGSSLANPEFQPDGSWLQVGEERFESAVLGLEDEGASRGFVVADLNRDGWPDLVKRDLFGPDVVHLSSCGAAAWLRVSLRADGTNPHGVGAWITVADQRLQVRAGGTGLATGGPPELLFGLADADRARLSVTWPDGRVDDLGSFETRRSILVRRADGG